MPDSRLRGFLLPIDAQRRHRAGRSGLLIIVLLAVCAAVPAGQAAARRATDRSAESPPETAALAAARVSGGEVRIAAT